MITVKNDDIEIIIELPIEQAPAGNFCDSVKGCLGISESGDENKYLNEKGVFQTLSGGGSVSSVFSRTGNVTAQSGDYDADKITETVNRFWLTAVLKSAYDSAVSWISTNGTNLINHLSNTSNPHSTTAAQVGAPSGSGTSTGTNTGDETTSSIQTKRPLKTVNGNSLEGSGDITISGSERIVISTDTTAANDANYTLVANAIFTDPTPVEGKGYSVLIRNGTATIGGTGYSTVGQLIFRVYHSGAWATYQLTTQTQLNAKQDSLGYTPVPNTRTITINGTSQDLSADRSWTVSATPTLTRIKTEFEYFDDFEVGNAGSFSTSESNKSYFAATAGWWQQSTLIANANGVIYASTGSSSSATLTVGAQSANSITPIGNGELVFQTRLYIPTLSTSGERFTVYCGFQNNSSAYNGFYRIRFNYSDNVNSGKWQLECNNISSTTADSGVTVVANTWYTLKAVVNAAGTSVEFFINDVSVGTINTNLPTSQCFQVLNTVKKEVGTTARLVAFDYIYACQKYLSSIR